MTLDEMARELGVSKTTVSRALSGKGRIGEKTRERILAYAMENREKGKNTAEEMMRDATHSLGVILPADIYEETHPFFQDCLLGICETVSKLGYYVVVVAATADDISQIKKLVERRRVDGVILTRALQRDKAVEYLTGLSFPLAMTGLCEQDEVVQVDTDNELAAESLTGALIEKGFRRFALIVDDLSYRVNKNRYNGFHNALMKSGIPAVQQIVYTGKLKRERLDAVIWSIVAQRAECIICGDDVICTCVMSRLLAEGYQIPRDIAIASLYDSQNLNCFTPPVTAVKVTPRGVGNMVADQLIRRLQGKDYERKIMMEYEVCLRRSTDRK